MKLKVIQNSCRICLRKSKKLRSIFKPMEDDDEAPHEMLNTITGIKVDETIETGKLPVLMCKDCILSLNIAYEFRAKALKSQTILETYSNLRKIGMQEEEETELEKVEILETALSDYDKDEYARVDFDAVYHAVGEEMQHEMQEEDLSADNSAALDLGYDETVVKHEYKMEDDIYDAANTTEESSQESRQTEINSQPAPNRRGRKRIYDVRPTDCTGDKSEYVLSTQEEASLVKMRTERKTDNGVGYICDICGNTYAKRFRMLEHRKGHDPELRHTCELCGKKFHLRERLRKHMYAHKDKKPHKCSYCSRTFFFESLKRTHEAIHQGSRPHVCEICNKAFAYSQALKNHQLIHAEIKHYHCDYCDKDFRLQHHLKQHEETKLHQNAVLASRKAEHLI